MARASDRVDPVKVWFFVFLGIDAVAIGVCLPLVFGQG